MAQRAGKDTRSVGDRSRSDRVLDRRHVRAFGASSRIVNGEGGQGCDCQRGTLNCSLSGLGSSGESSKTWVGRAAKLRCVKTRISMSRELIFGRCGRPSGPKSGLDWGEEGKGGGAGGGNAGGEPGEDCGEEEEEMDSLEERHYS